MTRSTLALPLAAVVAAGAAAYLIRASRRANEHPVSFGAPHVITVFRPLAEVAGNLPNQLTDRGGALEIELREAPESRGTEISVRPVNGAVSDAEIRRALRVSRSLLEVGDVLKPGVATTTPTLRNRLLRTMTRHGREEGLL
jgi:flagellar basal body-associated protein FliL